MHIAKRTPDLLVLTDTGASPRMIGVCILAVGGLFIYTGSQQSGLALTPIVIGALAALAGIAFVILPGRVIAAFDKPSHTLILTRRTFNGSTRDEVDFSKIADVTAEMSAMGRGGATYRVTVVLKDGTRLPLTTWYTSSPLHQVAADAAEEFLGISPPPTAPTAPSQYAMRLALRQRQHAQSRGSIGCVMLFCAIFLAVGSGMLFTMWTRLTHWLPVNATVTYSTITTVHGSKGGVSYRPDITYRYDVGGRTYYSGRSTILNESRSWNWATNVIRRYPVGSEVIAYVDPANPGRAFLIHEWSVFPFIITAIPLALILFFFWTWRQMPAHRRDGSPPATVAPGSGTT